MLRLIQHTADRLRILSLVRPSPRLLRLNRHRLCFHLLITQIELRHQRLELIHRFVASLFDQGAGILNDLTLRIPRWRDTLVAAGIVDIVDEGSEKSVAAERFRVADDDE